jgi:hypothetical protein
MGARNHTSALPTEGNSMAESPCNASVCDCLTIHSDLKLAGGSGGALAINCDTLSILPCVLLQDGLQAGAARMELSLWSPSRYYDQDCWGNP